MIFSHFVDWYRIPDEILKSQLKEAKENGVENLVFIDPWICRILRNPQDFGFFKHELLGKFNFFDMHAPYGECYDLACASQGRRDDVVKDHIRAMGYAADFGCKTYTIHIGAFDSVFFHKPNEEIRPLAVETLEKLIPAAEKYGIILAVENAFERSNTPEEVMYYVNYFNHPNVKCCFDSGHALIMDPHPGNGSYDSYMTDTVWSGKVEIFADAFEVMAPAMVTCHLHDNAGYSDQHLPPGEGVEKWDVLSDKLLNKAPQLLSIQSEAVIFGKGFALADVVKRYRKIFPGLA